MPASLSKARKKANRRRWKQADRAREAELKRPRCMGLVAAAELAVEEEGDKREREERPRQVAKRAMQTPMQRYLARGEITRQQFDDAERLWSDYMRSGLTAAVTGAYEAGSGGGGGLTPGCGPRYAQYQAAMRAVGIILSPVLSFVIAGKGSAGDWAKDSRRPRDVAMAMLVEALDALGRHYRGEKGLA